MAIKRVMCCTEIADSPFRSLQDVEKYLQSLKEQLNDAESLLRQYQSQFSRSVTAAPDLEFTINKDSGPGKKSPKIGLDKIDKFVVPKLDKLRSNFMIVDQLSEDVDKLNTLFSTVSVDFRGNRGLSQMLNNIKAMRNSAEAKLDAALKFLSKIGEKYAPTPFKEMADEVCKKLSEDLEFSSYKTFIYAHQQVSGDITFTLYVQLLNLVEEDGEQYPEFFIVFTCLLSPLATEKGVLTVENYVTVMNNFQTPGKFSPGRLVTNAKSALSNISTLLSLENISTSIGTLPHNLDPSKITKDKFKFGSKVANIEVDPNSISFAFLKQVKKDEAKSYANSLYVEVKNMFARIKNAQVKVKFTQEDGRFVVRFMLMNLATDKQINTNDLDFLKQQFDLDDNKLRKVIQIING